ncbi:MAG TPA: hypothetical protein VGH28_21975 [Polyangiaceae bacterium]
MPKRLAFAVVLAVVLTELLSACAVSVEGGRRCRYGWEPAHRDRWGRYHGGHCR